MRGRAEPKNHNPTLDSYSVISPLPFFHKCCLSGPYLENYN